MTSSSSPDINFLDFAHWSILVRDVSVRSHPNSDSLQATIQSAWTKMDEKVLRRFCASAKAHLRLMIKAGGGSFKILLIHYIFEYSSEESCEGIEE